MRSLHPVAGLLAALLTLCATAVAAAPENRCGWVVNPTPGNWWLTDRDASWTMMTQGADTELPGMDRVGDISAHDYVATNGSYGYACACMKVETDKVEKSITAILSFKQLKIAKCQNDKALPKPE